LIPDQYFEQTLIFQDIDSDGIVNGQVLTSDIDSLICISIENFLMTDICGIEDFVSLETLHAFNFHIHSSNTSNINELNLTNNTNLEYILLNGGDDAGSILIESINLSNNFNLVDVNVGHIWSLKELNLQTGNTDVSNLNINIDLGFPKPAEATQNYSDSNQLLCIKVTDAAAATAGTGVYSTWTISANNNPYYFSETCALNVDGFSKEPISIYPNPASDKLNIKSDIDEIQNVTIFDSLGRIVLNLNTLTSNEIDIQHLKNGVYIIKFESLNSVQNKRFIKN
jgi:hypothetical protein